MILCHEVYQKAGLKKLQTDECMLIRYVSKIIVQQQLTNDDKLISRTSCFQHGCDAR